MMHRLRLWQRSVQYTRNAAFRLATARLLCSSVPKKLRVFKTATNDPLFNLATEEWIFREGALDAMNLFLWRNSPTVVIGRNQNPWKECHIQQMEKDNVILARRYSGGGAVYQDLNNTNWTFLAPFDNRTTNFKIITSALSRFGVTAVQKGRNDIVVEDKKVSGSAYKISGRRFLHHGTLLINVNMDALQRYLNPNKLKLLSKGVESVKARVMNLATLNPKIHHDAVCDAIVEEFFKTFNSQCEVEHLDHNKLLTIPALRETYESLKDWKWRFGETPEFQHNFETRFDFGLFDVHCNSANGRITSIKVYSDCLYPQLVEEMERHLTGTTYDQNGIEQAMAKVKEALGNTECAAYIEPLQKWLVEAL